MRNSSYISLVMLAMATLFVACGKQPDDPVNNNTEPQDETPKISKEIQQASFLAQNVLQSYYLWSKEISKDIGLLNPEICEDPISVVRKIRYHQGNDEVDHWTQLTDDIKSMTSSVEGLGLTYGYELQAGRITNKTGVYFLIVCYVVKDGPAEKAGLKRGDLIMTIDGKDITADNIYDAFNTASVKLGIAHLTSDGYLGSVEKEVSLKAVDMWEDPILLDTTYTVAGKKVGYLVYNSFDVKSMETLPDVFRKFKTNGIEELILDLRYNGGGFVKTECELASLIAPYANVSAKDIFQTEIYSPALMQYYTDAHYDLNTYFDTEHTYQATGYNINQDISDANVDLKKVTFIVTDGSASASEGLIVGLGPYMDVTLVGNQTYGKYCAGWMMSAEDFWGTQGRENYSMIGNWGIYVMVSKFADKSGNNAAMPDGIPVDINASDNPLDGYQLGDENETMLKAALTAAGKPTVGTRAFSGNQPVYEMERIEHGKPRGILIKSDIPPVKFQ